jgi:hypothetical protein
MMASLCVYVLPFLQSICRVQMELGVPPQQGELLGRRVLRSPDVPRVKIKTQNIGFMLLMVGVVTVPDRDPIGSFHQRDRAQIAGDRSLLDGRFRTVPRQEEVIGG